MTQSAPRAASVRGSLLRGAAAVGSGVCAGGVVRFAASGPSAPERAAAAMTVVLAVAVPLAALVDAADRSLRGRLAAAGQFAAWTCAAAAAAGLAAGGGTGSLGGALVVASVAVLALGIASVLRRAGADRAVAAYVGVGLACVPAALIFVADPWIEWEQGGAASPSRAAFVLRANPLAAMTSSSGGLGVDFQRMPWLYDGPDAGVPGLSVVGQYYPSIPPAAIAWSLATLSVGAVLVALSGRRSAQSSSRSPAGEGSLCA